MAAVLDAVERPARRRRADAARRAGPAADWPSSQLAASRGRADGPIDRSTEPAGVRPVAGGRSASHGRGGRARPRRRPRRRRRSCGCRRRWRCSGRTRRSAVVGRAPCRSPRGRRSVDRAVPAPVTAGTARRHQWTILEIGSSMMSVAPASFSAGISMLMLALGHHRLDRVAAAAVELVDRRRLHRRQQVDHRVEVGSAAR